MSQSGDLKFLKLLMVLGLWSLPALAQAQTKPAAAPTVDTPTPAAQQQKTPATAPAPTAAAANPSEYAGAEACKACHADIYTGWEKSPHWKQTYKEGGIAKHGCEDCHGAAVGHVAGGGDKTKIFLFEEALHEGNQRALPGAAMRAARST